MKLLSATKLASTLGLAAVISGAFLAYPLDSAAAPKAIPKMTIKIFNNDPNYNIYPVLTTGTSASNLWLRAWFGITKEAAEAAEKAGKPFYPKRNNFRIYINPTGTGIPPGGAISLTLPFITQLVATNRVDPKKDDQYIDWWGGGRVEIFASPVGDASPPPELATLYTNRPTQTAININRLPDEAIVPICASCQQPLKMFKDTGGVFKNNAPSQLTEYTLGAINQDKNPPVLGTYFGAVDIDVSYVDTAFLPAAMAPYDPKSPPLNQVGYVGTPQRIDVFKTALTRFLGSTAPGAGWPQFITDKTPRTKILKLPSTAHALAGDPDLSTPPWAPITKLTTNWRNCIPDSNQTQICKDIRQVRLMFNENYKNYKAIYDTAPSCDHTKEPVDLTEALMITHVYGFTPFGENCTDAKLNLIEKTPGYAENNAKKFNQVKDIFDKLQYLPSGAFNPFVGLIHGEDYINAPNVYAYSVDDAVGNLQADGNGFIIAVGGTRGLPNPTPASPPVNVNFGAESAFGEWTHFGVCTTDKTKMRPKNPDFLSFAFYVQKDKLDQCPISLLAKWKPGGEEVVYSFKLKTLDFTFDFDPLHPLTPKTRAPIDCRGLKEVQAALCKDIYAYSLHHPGKGPDARKVVVPALYPHEGSR